MGKTIEKYGYLVDVDTPLLKIELQAYKDGITVEKGGLGAEEHFKRAFRLMWPNYIWNDWAEIMTWAWCNWKYQAVIGHQRAGKTWHYSHMVYLDYCAAPETTITSIATVTLQGLKTRMWGDVLSAIQSSSIPCPFKIASTSNEMQLSIGDKSRKDLDKYMVHGLSINDNKDAEGRIRGAHAPRRRLIGDESEDMSPVIYSAMTNPASAPDGKVALLTNPKTRISHFGNFVTPKNGWSTVNESDLWWETAKGGVCLHLNGLDSPNVKAGRVIVPGLMTKEGIDEIRKVDGEHSVAWYSRALGWFAPDGMVSRIFPESIIAKARNEIDFDFSPDICASLDPAYENDKAPMHFGKLGKLRDKRLAVNCTETLVMNYKIGADQEPKDYQLAHWVMEECQKRGVKPQHFIMDKTGGGRGTFAILQKEWSPDIQGVEYGGAATDRVIRQDESTKANEMYKKFVTELWFRARHCIADGILGGMRSLDPEVETDLNAREYELKQFSEGERIVAESKVEMKKRLGRSPDHGDAYVQFGELLARLGTAPGAHGPEKPKSQGWANARLRAKKANAVYETETYAHF